MGFWNSIDKNWWFGKEAQRGLSYDLIWKRKKECFDIELKSSCQKFGNGICDGLIKWMDMKEKRKHFLTLSWKACIYEVNWFIIANKYFYLNFHYASIKYEMLFDVVFLLFYKLILLGKSLG